MSIWDATNYFWASEMWYMKIIVIYFFLLLWDWEKRMKQENHWISDIKSQMEERSLNSIEENTKLNLPVMISDDDIKLT